MAECHYEDFVEDASVDPEVSTLAGSPSLEDLYGYPEVLPRVGEEYQAEIPAMVTECNYFQLRQRQCDTENRSLDDNFLFTQQAVPLMWIHDKGDSSKDQLTDFVIPLMGSQHFSDTKVCEVDAKDSSFTQISYHDPILGGYLKTCSFGSVSKLSHENPNIESELYHTAYSCGEDPSNDEFKMRSIQIDNALMCKEVNSSTDTTHEIKHCPYSQFVDLKWHLVPGAPGENWCELERESFLLGLYIFGKNLVQIQRFMETKKMGEILCFYYGDFFKSEPHRKWSECRKTRSKRCIHGHRIFNGPRQQELLIRLMPHVSEESKESLLEKTRAYNDGKVVLEEYVNAIKMTAGLGKLVEVVGLGKGKQDITGIIAEPTRSNQPVMTRTEIPAGKACSSLTSEEIFKFLTGGFRLSKARSNDLFWEAVWPRLLARGWHSEQPKSGSYSKNSLVFLIPGIKKFSRRKLVKGTHYFDSLSDVLNQVTLDPGLLEIEADGTRGSGEAIPKLDEKVLPDHQSHSYLRPRISNTISQNIQFMIVDTSMKCEEPYQVREMRTMPVDSGSHSPACLTTDTEDDDSSEDLVDESISAEGKICVKVFPTKRGHIMGTNVSAKMQPVEGQLVFPEQTSLRDVVDNAKVVSHNLERGPATVSSKEKYHGSNRTTNCSQKKYSHPASKQQSLSSGDVHREDHLLFTGPKVKKEEPSLEKELRVRIPETGPNSHTQESENPNTSFGGRWETSSGEVCSGSLNSKNSQEKDLSLCEGKSLRHPLIDLNLPHCATNVEMDDAFDTQAVDHQDNHHATRGTSFPVETSQLTGKGQAFEASDSIVGTLESAEHGRRQSTRNRPLTLRALESMAYDFSSTKRRIRHTKSGESDELTPRPRRRRMKDTRISSQNNSLNDTVVIATIMPPKEGIDEEGSSNKLRNYVHSDQEMALGLIGLSNSLCPSEISTGKNGQPG